MSEPVIVLDDRWALGADKYQYILFAKAKKPRKDGREWNAETYHPSIDFALKHWVDTIGLTVTKELGGLTLSDIRKILEEIDARVGDLAKRIDSTWPDDKRPSAYKN